MAFVAVIRAFSPFKSSGAVAGVATVTGGNTRESGATSAQPAVSSNSSTAVYLTNQSHPISMSMNISFETSGTATACCNRPRMSVRLGTG